MMLLSRLQLASFVKGKALPLVVALTLTGCGPDYKGAIEDTQDKSEVVSDTNGNDQPNTDQSPQECVSVVNQAQHKKGESLYVAQCLDCHGVENKGGAGTFGAFDLESSNAFLIKVTAETMPLAASEKCDTDCAEDIIYYLKPEVVSSTQCSDDNETPVNDGNDTSNDDSSNDDSSNDDSSNDDSSNDDSSNDDSSNDDSSNDDSSNDDSSNDDSSNDDSSNDDSSNDDSSNDDSSNDDSSNDDSSNDDSSNDDSSNDDSSNDDTSNTDMPDVDQCDMVTGKAYWEQTCAFCHGKTNQGGASRSVDMQRLVSQKTMKSADDVAGLAKYINDYMPGTPSLCMGDEPGTCAYDSALYIMKLESDGDSCEQDNGSQSLQIEQKPMSSVLYKATFSLAGRFPTDAEVQAVEKNGISALDNKLDQLMQEEPFFVRLKEIYNDMLLLGPRSADMGGFDENWYKTLQDNGSDTDASRFARNLARDAFDDEAFHLIRYIVENNRPFTELLTADYTAVNPYSAHIMRVHDQLSFRNWSETPFPEESALREDPNHIQKVKLPDYAHAGILTTRLFLDESGTSGVNRNRHRSYLVFEHFLNFNLFSIPGTRPMADSPSKSETMDNPTCSGCHNIMDPVASAFQNYNDKGHFAKPSRWYSEKGEMQPTGFAATGEVFDPESGEDPLQWVAQRIAKDPAFAEATVKRIAEGLTGQKMLRDVEAILDEDKALYELQQSLLGVWKTAFINSNYNLKSLIKTIIKSPYYSPESVSGVSNKVADKIGAVRMLTPEMVTRKYEAAMGEGVIEGVLENNILYGGIDYESVTTRLLEPNGFITAMQETYANKVACDLVKNDFDRDNNDRLYFANLSLDDSPSDSGNEAKVRQAIQKLIWLLWGEKVGENDAQVTQAYNLIKDVHAAGMADNAKSNNIDCTTDNGRIRRDDSDYVERSWNLLASFLLSDFKFLYE